MREDKEPDRVGEKSVRSGLIPNSFLSATSTTRHEGLLDFLVRLCLVTLPTDSDLCLKFAMLCTLNDKCDRLRKAYGEACSGIRCQRHLCLAQLRSFFEKAAESHAQGLLLCPCAPEDAGCGERRRNTIAPSCALPSVVPNCLDLRSFCRADPLCRCRERVDRMGRAVAHLCILPAGSSSPRKP